MQYTLKNHAGVPLCEVDDYNKAIIRKEAGREVTKLLRAGTSRTELTIADGTGLSIITITVDVRKTL